MLKIQENEGSIQCNINVYRANYRQNSNDDDNDEKIGKKQRAERLMKSCWEMNHQLEHEQKIHIKQVLYTSVRTQRDYCNTFCSGYLSQQKIVLFIF